MVNSIPHCRDDFDRRREIESRDQNLPLVGMNYGRSIVDWGWVTLLLLSALMVLVWGVTR